MEPDFYDKVFQVVKQIPSGRVTTYGAIAKMLGVGQASRMIGWALNKCGSEKEFVPAHRVVNRNGLLTGKNAFPGERMMQELLENEGVKVENDRVLMFKEIFWDPKDLLK